MQQTLQQLHQPVESKRTNKSGNGEHIMGFEIRRSFISFEQNHSSNLNDEKRAFMWH